MTACEELYQRYPKLAGLTGQPLANAIARDWDQMVADDETLLAYVFKRLAMHAAAGEAKSTDEKL